jgi:hypothetical protein
VFENLTRGVTAVAVLVLVVGGWMVWNSTRDAGLEGARAVMTEACADELRSTVLAMDASVRPSLVIQEFDYRPTTLEEFVGYAELVSGSSSGPEPESVLDEVFRRCSGEVFLQLDPRDRRFGNLLGFAFQAIEEEDIRHLSFRMRDGMFEISGTTPELRRRP